MLLQVSGIQSLLPPNTKLSKRPRRGWTSCTSSGAIGPFLLCSNPVCFLHDHQCINQTKRTRTDYSGQVRSARNDLYKLRIRKHSHPGYNLFQFLPLVGATEQLFTGHCLHVVSTKTSTTAFTETNHAVNTLWLYLYYTYSNSHNSLPPSIYRTSYPPL